jgi:hypothetical protein
MIKRDTTKVPQSLSNAAASLIEDTLEHCEISKAEAARAMNIQGVHNSHPRGFETQKCMYHIPSPENWFPMRFQTT